LNNQLSIDSAAEASDEETLEHSVKSLSFTSSPSLSRSMKKSISQSFEPRMVKSGSQSFERGMTRSGSQTLGGNKVCHLREIYREDVFACVFCFFDGHSIAMLLCVCSDWNELLRDPILWQSACRLHWPHDAQNHAIVHRYNFSWIQMLKERAHIRYDGIYVLETLYWNQGGERFGERTQRIVEVRYYRYLHLRPTGEAWYALLNHPPSLTEPINSLLTTGLSKHLYRGQWAASPNNHHIYVKVDVKHETQFMKLRCVCTDPGKWNRLEMVEFQGKGPRDLAASLYPVPRTPFIFYCTSGIPVFEADDLKERMRVLVESNEDLDLGY